MYPTSRRPFLNKLQNGSLFEIIRTPIFGFADRWARAARELAKALPNRAMNSRRLTRPPNLTRMPEYQMTDLSAKQMLQRNSAEARDVGCGSESVAAGGSQRASGASGDPPISRHKCGSSSDDRSLPTRKQLNLGDHSR